MHRHVRRLVARALVLVSADLLAFFALRAALRALREGVAVDGLLGRWLTALMPAGYLDGWQLGAALLLGLLVTGNYGHGDWRRDPWRLFIGCALAVALPLWMTLWTDGPSAVVGRYIVTVILIWLVLAGERLTVDRVVAWVWPPEVTAAPAIFVGTSEDCRRALASPAFSRVRDLRGIGFVDTHNPAASGALGHVREFSSLLESTGAEAVVLCGSLSDTHFHGVVEASFAAGCQVLAMPRRIEAVGVDPAVLWRGGEPVVQLTAPSLRGQQLYVKRVMDVAGSLLGFVLGLPLMLIIAVAVRLDSRGPVLFRQRRVGMGGRPFEMLKFRTMQEDAESLKHTVAHLNASGDQRLFKVPNDPRVTRLGAFLRRWSLDELPQLWNVLVGEMSLVGPRPFFEDDLVLYEVHHFGRLGAKPGITGLWQVSGRSDIVDFEEVVELDTRYVREWSILLDIKILLMTGPAVLRRRGAV